MVIRNPHTKVPMAFRAQIAGRCQIQRLPHAKKDAYRWVDEWIEAVEEKSPQFPNSVQTKSYTISWRLLTNSGLDDTVITPAIGANGFPFFPGSSMKGTFLRACNDNEASTYCGKAAENQEPGQGCLRFHGGYPKNLDWIEEDLVDLVHPQEKFQVMEPDRHSAFAQISLHKPIYIFGISSQKPLDENAWQNIWDIWEKALSFGIGSRVSAGYGQVIGINNNQLLKISLGGTGLCPKLIIGKGEFRPNIFKAALRGHTLRLLGGVTDKETAIKITKELWGGFNGRNGSIVGALSIAFETDQLSVTDFIYTPGHNPVKMPIFNLKQGNLSIKIMKPLSSEQKQNYTSFIKELVRFAMLLGGFGPSWRRANHKLFFPKYLDNGDKPMIGTHWSFKGKSGGLYNFIKDANELNKLTQFLDDIHNKTLELASFFNQPLNQAGCNWREAFHPDKVQVWGRFANDRDDSHAIYWFHKPYQQNKSIKQTNLTGKLSNCGRIWHRMYPNFFVQDGKIKSKGCYIELLTVFPDDAQSTHDFLCFLEHQSEFTKLWGH